MIKISDLQAGDIVMADYEGQLSRGVVTALNKEDREVSVETAVQTYWYTPDQLFAVPVDDSQLQLLGFEKENVADGSIKYKKGPFRIVVQKEGDFSKVEMWYREDHRHFHEPLYVHQLQNHYYQMTKVELVP